MNERDASRNARIHGLEAALTEAQARIAQLEAALRQRSLQLEALDGGAAFAPQRPPVALVQPSPRKAPSTAKTIAFLRPHLDAAYYLRENPDVAQARMDPVQHYVRHGEGEGRRPSPGFDPVRYRVMNPALARFEGNLFWHYLTDDQGRTPKAKG